MANPFSDELKEHAQPVWTQIFEHPFLAELRQGTLPLDKFRYYMVQDFHYLEGFARAVSIALSKAPDTTSLQLLSRRLTTPIERPFHTRLFQLMEIDESEAAKTDPSPTNRAYVNHMLVAASLGGVGEAASALLPCPWTYHLLGERLGKIEHPTYSQWAGFYSAGLLQESVAAWRELVDRFGREAGQATRERMRRIFLTSSRYEYLFWDMAYRQEQWPV